MPATAAKMRAASMETLAGLLGESARRRPNALAVIEQAGRSAWSGLPETAVGLAELDGRSRRLAAFLADLSLDPGAAVGIALPNGSESWLSILAVQAAGLTPCMLDVTWDAADLSAAVEAADIRAVITQSVLGPDRPAATIAFVAAGFVRLRHLLGFGPGLPRGVTGLDPILNDRTRDADRPQRGGGDIVTFARSEGRPATVRHSMLGLISAAAAFLTQARVRPGDRLLTVMPPDDLAGLATGGIAALAADTILEPHGVFDSTSLRRALDRPEPLHLVVPGWVAPLVAESRVADRLRSVTLIHQAPVRLSAVTDLSGHVVDVVSLGETALLVGARDAGRPGIPLALPGGHLEAAIRDDGRIRVRGPGVMGDAAADGWAETRFHAGSTASALLVDIGVDPA